MLPLLLELELELLLEPGSHPPEPDELELELELEPVSHPKYPNKDKITAKMSKILTPPKTLFPIISSPETGPAVNTKIFVIRF